MKNTFTVSNITLDSVLYFKLIIKNNLKMEKILWVKHLITRQNIFSFLQKNLQDYIQVHSKNYNAFDDGDQPNIKGHFHFNLYSFPPDYRYFRWDNVNVS